MKMFHLLQSANYDYYELMTELCCSEFEPYEFPVFTSTAEEVRPAEQGHDLAPEGEGHDTDSVGEEVKDGEARVDSPKPVARKESVRAFDVTQGMSNLSLALSLGTSHISITRPTSASLSV